jgi:mevalonate kinase
MKNFETRTYGKWILAGEHSVLRGGEALVFPLKSQYLDWSFQPGGSSLEVEIPKGYPEEFKLLFWSVFEKACQISKIPQDQISGKLVIKAHILVGSGLGASATLCVALTRWLISLGYVNSVDDFKFAKNLEDVFHGESSGVDVAVVLKESGLIFKKETVPQSFTSQFQPRWYLSHCGEKGITKECVLKVKKLWQLDSVEMQKVDLQMKQAVDICKKVLGEKESANSTAQLIEALNLGRKCFESWELITPKLQDHISNLEKQGALAVKPTGSGGGGFVLSLWGDKPDENFLIENKMLKASVL